MLRHTTTKAPKKKKAAKNMKVGSIMMLPPRSEDANMTVLVTAQSGPR
jgi:hypothetical protein